MYCGIEKQELKELCNNWFHKKFYKQIVKETESGNIHTTEYLCGKCGKKVCGFTTFSLDINLTNKR